MACCIFQMPLKYPRMDEFGWYDVALSANAMFEVKSMQNFVDGPEMPMGLGMALAQNLPAMNRFASLSPAQQKEVIARTRSIGSKDEMTAYVQSLLR